MGDSTDGEFGDELEEQTRVDRRRYRTEPPLNPRAEVEEEPPSLPPPPSSDEPPSVRSPPSVGETTSEADDLDGDRPSEATIRHASLGAPTQADFGSSTITSAGTSTILSHDALVQERRLQGLNGLKMTVVIALLCGAALQFSRVRTPTHYYATAAILLLAVVASWQYVQLRRGATSAVSNSSALVGVASAFVTIAAIAHVGVLSPVCIVLAVSVYFFGLSDMQGRAWLVYLASALGYAFVAGLAIAGVLPLTKSVLPLAEENIRGVVILGGVVEVVLAGTFALARMGRKTTLQAMEQLESARREIRQREALLEEAREELDRALDVGKVGRFTGQDVGPYIAHEVIGRGGMGEVYRAIDRQNGAELALKILHPQLQDDEDHVRRFFREAKISSDLHSPNIVEVLGSGHAADGSPYLAMELLIGESLAQLLRRQRRLKVRDIATLVSQIAQALTVAQEADIVHRDLKPQNLFRTKNGVWKVLDFGVSKIVGASVTLAGGEIIGTPSYMSPEQARGLAVDHRSDVFSLGSIVYRAFTGRPAFYAPDPIAVLYNVMESMPVRPCELVKADTDIDLALALAMAKDRERRLRSATSFAAALHDAARGELDDRLREAAHALLHQFPWAAEAVDAEAMSERPPPASMK